MKDMKHMARMAGPAMDGSRFEHWFGSSKEIRLLTARIGVAWAKGLAPDVAYEACRVGRLITPWKPKGGLRPLVITAALRRIVLKSLARVVTPALHGHLLLAQHAIGDVRWHREALPRGVDTSGHECTDCHRRP